MIELEIPKDIRAYEAKLIGPFTTRQLFCAIGGALGFYGSYKAAAAVLGEDSSLIWLFPIIVAIPFALIGWVKLYGLTFEKFAKSVFVSMFLAPTKRLYKIENTFDKFDKLIDDEEKARFAKENPEAAKAAKAAKAKKKKH